MNIRQTFHPFKTIHTQAALFCVLSLTLGLMLTPLVSSAQCPAEPRFSVTHEQSTGSNDGTLQATFTGTENFDPKSGTYSYHLWNDELGGYVYNPAGLDPGFKENPAITLSFTPPNIITFKNLPPSQGYFVVLTGKSCQNQYGAPSEGITIKAFNKQGK